MQKTAQERGILNRVREKVSPTGKLEEFFDPEFKSIMEKLRKVDDQIRAELTGKQIGDEVPSGPDGKPIGDVDDVPNFKQYIKDAEKHLNRKEYMKSFADLGKLHSVMEKVSKLVSDFEVELDTVHERFLFSDLVPDRYEEGSEEYARYLDELKKKFMKKQKEANKKYNLIVQAGIFDFLSNIGTDRGRALSIWEKRYPKKVKALKVVTNSMISAAKSLETNVLKILKSMSTARATRDVDNYVIQSNNLVNIFNSFDSKFKSYYNDHIRKFLEKQELFAPTKETEEPKELANKEIVNEEVEEQKKPEFSFELDTAKSPEEFSSTQLGLPFGGEEIGNRPLESTIEKTLAPEIEKTPMAPEAPPTTVSAPAVGPTGTIPMSREEYSLRRGPAPLTRMPPAPAKPSIPFGAMPEKTLPMSIEEEQLRALMRQTAPGPISFEPSKPPTVEHRRGISKVRPASEQFIESLESLSFESPAVLAKYITKYAETIREKEPETYHKLMNIVSFIEV